MEKMREMETMREMDKRRVTIRSVSSKHLRHKSREGMRV